MKKLPKTLGEAMQRDKEKYGGGNMAKTTDLNKFVQDAIRTESKIEKVKVNKSFLFNVLALYISSGQMLDQIKKHVFYDKGYDVDNINNAYLVSGDALHGLMGVPLRDELNEEDIEIDPRIFHGIVGSATEATELVEAMHHSLITHTDLDTVNLGEEVGDDAWYKAILVDALGLEYADVLNTVIEKLNTRYPEGYSNDNAINRNLDKEREVLEK